MAAVEQIPLCRLRPIDLQRFGHPAPTTGPRLNRPVQATLRSVGWHIRVTFACAQNVPFDAGSTCLIDRLDASFGGHHVNHRRFYNIGNVHAQARDGDVHRLAKQASVDLSIVFLRTIVFCFRACKPDHCRQRLCRVDGNIGTRFYIQHPTSNIEHRSKRMEKWQIKSLNH